MKNIILSSLLLIFISFHISAQVRPVELSIGGGIKKNIFKTVNESYTAYNINPSYDINLIKPKIYNTISFFTDFRISKKINRHIKLTIAWV